MVEECRRRLKMLEFQGHSPCPITSLSFRFLQDGTPFRVGTYSDKPSIVCISCQEFFFFSSVLLPEHVWVMLQHAAEPLPSLPPLWWADCRTQYNTLLTSLNLSTIFKNVEQTQTCKRLDSCDRTNGSLPGTQLNDIHWILGCRRRAHWSSIHIAI